MNMKYFKRFVQLGLVLMASQFCLAQAAKSTEKLPELPAKYAATAVGQAGSVAGKSFGLSVYVEGLTSTGELEELAATLKNKGEDGLEKAMDDMKDKGRVSPVASTGTTMRVVRIRLRKDGGQRITLVTNRPISFAEVRNSSRSRDYRFAIVVLNVDKDGKGTGTFVPMCKIRFNKKKELEIENYGQEPFRLVNVYRQK